MLRCVNADCPLWRKCARGQDHPDDESYCRSFNFSVEDDTVTCKGFVYAEDAKD